jgi:hypothetical protein
MLRWQHLSFPIVDPNWHRSDGSLKSANGSRAIERWGKEKQKPSYQKEKQDGGRYVAPPVGRRRRFVFARPKLILDAVGLSHGSRDR